jgi:hypothetical protein
LVVEEVDDRVVEEFDDLVVDDVTPFVVVVLYDDLDVVGAVALVVVAVAASWKRTCMPRAFMPP